MESSILRIVAHLDPVETETPAGQAPLAAGPVAAERRLLGAIQIECVEAQALPRYQAAWADLCERLLEPNIFLEPAFALPLLQHVASAQRPSFLLVWEEAGPASFGRLLGLFPLDLASGHRRGLVAGFDQEQASCGIPLVDRDHPAETIEAVLNWLRVNCLSADALLLTNVVEDGPFHAALRRFCTESARDLAALDPRSRAVLRRRGPGEADVACFLSAKRRKERARQHRRLAEAGVLLYQTARTPAEIAAATERFLALEHNGWKGARGTALLADPSLATFTRTMTRMMAHEGKCRIDSITIDGAAVAMGIMLMHGDQAYFWKTSFDEAYASRSPGVHLAMDLTRTQLDDHSIAMTDSCAVANHPMIDKLWPDRLAVVDVVLAVKPDDDKRFARSLEAERARRTMRRKAKGFFAGTPRRVANWLAAIRRFIGV